MDRNETIRIAKLVAFGGLTESDASILLIQFCKENGKTSIEAVDFVTSILRNKELLLYCINVALDFYERKFTVCKLWGPINLYSIGQKRNLLLIF